MSQLLFAHDAGLRGDISVTFSLRGSLAQNAITTDIELANARRAEFVPPSPLSLEATCNAVAQRAFQSFSSIECHWPPADSSDPSILIVAADLPDVGHPESSSGQITLPALPADRFFNWLSVATRYPPTGLANSSGALAGALSWGTDPLSGGRQPEWSGELGFSGGSVAVGSGDQHPIALGDILLRSTPSPAEPAPHSHRLVPASPSLPPDSFDLLPISLDLGGEDPAILDGHLDSTGYTLHLSGSAIPARLVALGDAIPQLGDGLKDCLQRLGLLPTVDAPVPTATPRGGMRGNEALPGDKADAAPAADPATQVDLTATRTWGSPQTWQPTAAPPPRQARARN